MKEVEKKLQVRKKDLLQIKIEKENALIGAPEGSLRISCSERSNKIYLRSDPKDFCGTYIPQKDRDLARRLAQKDYDEKVLRSINKELSAIDKYLSACKGTRAEDIYEKLHRERQKLVVPIRETDEQWVRNWESIPYQGKEIDDSIPPIYTTKGERVRSKSEMIIADAMYNENVPYLYECPIVLKGWGTVYPDFTALNVKKRKVIYWEHFGIMDDPEYSEKAIQKIALYEENGIFVGENLIITWESKKCPINPQKVKKMINKYLL